MITAGELLYEARAAKKLTLRDVATETGVSHTTVSQIEKGTPRALNTSCVTAHKLCSFLGIDSNLFLKAIYEETRRSNTEAK